MPEITYEITAKIGTINVNPRGWTKELNMISWNGHPPKFDLREWSPDHERMAKGITLSDLELANLRKLIKDLDLPMEDLPEDAPEDLPEEDF